jgi:hypothetical protein
MWLFQAFYLQRKEKRVDVAEGEINTDQKQRPEFMNERVSVLESKEEAKGSINSNITTLQNLAYMPFRPECQYGFPSISVSIPFSCLCIHFKPEVSSVTETQ